MKKLIVMLALLCLLPLAFSADVSLVRNHCSPVGCEQIYKINSVSQFQIQENPNFKIAFEKLTGSTPGKANYYFGTETEQTTITPVFKSDCQIIKDVNGEKYPTNCRQVFAYNKTETVKTINWKPGFYAKQVEAGKTHYIKIELKTEPSQKFSVDVVLTFEGNKYAQWAWWNAGWEFKQKITLQTDAIGLSGNITTNHVILVDVNSENVDFWTNVAADGDDVRFTDVAEIVEYNYYFQDFNYSGQKMLAWVLVTDTFTSAADTEFYLYYGNAGAGKGEAPIATLAGLEAAYHFDDYDTGKDVNSANYDFNMVATNALIWDAATPYLGDSSLNINEQYYASQTTLWDVTPANLTVSFWMRPNELLDSSDTENYYILDKRNIGAATDIVIVAFQQADGAISVQSYVGGVAKIIPTSQTSWAQDTWYHFLWTWNTTSGIEIYVNGSVSGSDATATTLMEDGSIQDFWLGRNYIGSADFPGWLDELRIYNFGFTPSDANLMYNIENGTILTFGEQQIPGNLPDVNISKVEGFDLSAALPYFSYFADGNLAIDFNVFDLDNDRLTIDLNYHTSAERGTGTIIYSDLNLDSQFCPGLDWNETAVICSVDFNIMGIGDNNFYLKILVKDSTDSDFSSSGSTLGIDNNAPVYISIGPFGDSFIFQDAANFWLYASDSYSGLHNCNYTSYFNGVPSVNKTVDFNASGFCPVTELLGDAGSSAFVRYYSISDHAGNTVFVIHDTGTLTRAFSYLADPENILDRDIGRAIAFFGFAGLQAIGMAAGLIIIFLVVKKLLLG